MRYLKPLVFLRQLVKPNYLFNTCIAKYGYSSSVDIQAIIDDDNVVAVKKKPKKPPFAKNLFLGIFDHDFLIFEESISSEVLKALNQTVDSTENYFSGNVDSSAIDKAGKIPDEVVATMRQLGFFGLQIPTEYGGLGLGPTESTRYLEVAARDASLATMLDAHNLSIKAIQLYGSAEQKHRYLPRLASGEWIAAMCLTEAAVGSDPTMAETLATQDSSDCLVVNGSKHWVTNAERAQLFVVFGNMLIFDNYVGRKNPALTVMLIERDFAGVTVSEPNRKAGLCGSVTSQVRFDNTPLPPENILHEPGKGYDVLLNVLNSGRYTAGAATACRLKQLLKATMERVVTRRQLARDPKDCELVQARLGKVACDIYALESMTYLTAYAYDMFDDPDLLMESAITKAFSVDRGKQCIDTCLSMVGSQSLMSGFPYERYWRDMQALALFDGANDVTKLYVALIGLEHVLYSVKTTPQNISRSLLHPGTMFRSLLETRRGKLDQPKLGLNLFRPLHPSLKRSSQCLEYAVMRLKYVVHFTLMRHTDTAGEKQVNLMRLTAIVTEIYAMTAVLARASRSYCTGISFADTEIYSLLSEFLLVCPPSPFWRIYPPVGVVLSMMLLATTFCYEARRRVERLALCITSDESDYQTVFKNFLHIADAIVKSGGCPVPPHPHDSGKPSDQEPLPCD